MADIDNILDLFDCNDSDEDNSNVPKNEHYYIAETLKLIKETNDFPLYIYSMLKTLLQKKHLLTDIQIKEFAEILNIKPVVIEKKVIVEKKIYIDRKPKVYEDDY